MNRSLAPLVALTMAFSAPAFAATDEFADIDTRPGVTVGLMTTKPAGDPVAAAILLIGGDGKLGLWRGGGARSRNFLVRARGLFAERGVLTIAVDVPSDRRQDGLDGFRGSEEHRADMAAVLSWVRGRTGAPVWLIGASRGTVSMGHVAGKLPIDGAVFTATVVRASRRRPPTALDGDLESIRAPVLVVHHREDGCVVTPVDRLDRLTRRLTGATKVETLLFEGGRPAESEPCQARSPHGFFGIEGRVTEAIVGWMRANGPR